MTAATDVLDPLEGKSSTLYLAAGAVLAGFAANTAARTFADSGVEAIHSIMGPGGFFVSFVALFALYRALAADGSRLARVAAIVAVVPLIGWFIITVAGIGSAVGVLPGASVILPGFVFPVIFLTTILSYLLIAAATLRSGVYSRTVAVLLLSPAAVFLVLLVGVILVGPARSLEFVVDIGHAVGHLAIGATLRSESATTDHPSPATDATP